MAKVCLSFEASCYDHFDVCVFVDVSVARMLDKCVLLVCVCPAEYDWACVCACVSVPLGEYVPFSASPLVSLYMILFFISLL